MTATAAIAAPVPEKRDRTVGVSYALAAYLAWGLSPIYFKAVKDAPAFEVLAHRVIWSAVFLALLLAWYRKLRSALALVRQPRRLAPLLVTTLLIGSNWYMYLWAVTSGHILQASLGYYINPLVNVALGVVFLKERLTRPLIACLALVAVGVVWLAVSPVFVNGGAVEFPWLALALAVSFGFYALLRKRASVDGMTGLAVETTLLLPAALAFLLWFELTGRAAWLAPAERGGALSLDVLLPLAGIVTTLPLLWFTEGARRLTLTTMGLLQYMSPTLQFTLAVAVYGERFTWAHALAFACIWTALGIYTAVALRGRRRA